MLKRIKRFQTYKMKSIYLRYSEDRLNLCNGESLIVLAGIKEELAKVQYPAAFLDFETVMPAIPSWDRCRPYTQVPVQFSCHYKRDSQVNGAL